MPVTPPNLARMIGEGFSAVALAAMPTFTNPNNVAIACGAPPARATRRRGACSALKSWRH